MITFEVKDLASKRGIENAYQFSLACGLPTLSAYMIWNGEAKRIDLTTLEKICKALRCAPGKLIVNTKKKATS